MKRSAAVRRQPSTPSVRPRRRGRVGKVLAAMVVGLTGGLLLAVPAASCGKTFLDAWAVRLRAGEPAITGAEEGG